jgi:cytochrome c-type biogenesis protein CcmH/NrfF
MRLSRIAQLGFIALVVMLSTGASDLAGRYETLGHKMMCTCGCNQVLIECNHVGCSNAGRMLADLRETLSRGDSDTAVLQAFQEKYGPTALAVPMFTRFNSLAWIAPPLAFLLGVAFILLLLWRWKMHKAEIAATPDTPALLEIRESIRKEIEQ